MSKGSWDSEFDVVIVGYGGAGAAAAISAHDNGSNVIILEKEGSPGGTTSLSTGLMMIPSKRFIASAKRYVANLTGSVTDRESISAFVSEASLNVEWLENLGASVVKLGNKTISGFPTIGRSGPGFKVNGSNSFHIFVIKGGYLAGEDLFGVLRKGVESRRIGTVLNTRVGELVMSSDNAVEGVVADSESGRSRIRARKAVILACGGFEYNEVMKKNYLPIPFDALGSEGNTGDGIALAAKVGAQLWHMNAVSAALSYKMRGVGIVPHFMPTSRFIYVDQDGRRFCDETGLEGHTSWMHVSRFNTKTLRYPAIPAFVVFDEMGRKEGPIGHFRSALVKGTNAWSKDNSREISRGWIKKGDSIGQLATRLNIVARNLSLTIEQYNEYCKKKEDLSFHRAASTLKRLEPPFYGISIWPALGNTQGGPKRNSKCQVLDNNDKPIGNLYSAGSLGSLWGFLYQGGGNISECLTSGRIAGREASRMKFNYS